MTNGKTTNREELFGHRPTWAEIDLDALAANFQTVRERVGPNVQVMAVVKADAYGHGAARCAQRLAHEGVNCQVLNARNDEAEAHVVARAGAPGAVTISTNWQGAGLISASGVRLTPAAMTLLITRTTTAWLRSAGST